MSHVLPEPRSPGGHRKVRTGRETFESNVTCENWANSLSASIGMCPSSSWQQSLWVGGSVRWVSAWYRRSLTMELTVLESAWERTSGGRTACTGTPWKPSCWGSLWTTGGRRPGGAGSRSSLEGREKERERDAFSGVNGCVWRGGGVRQGRWAAPFKKAETSRSWGMQSSP